MRRSVAALIDKRQRVTRTQPRVACCAALRYAARLIAAAARTACRRRLHNAPLMLLCFALTSDDVLFAPT
jgi:hypothetical protein